MKTQVRQFIMWRWAALLLAMTLATTSLHAYDFEANGIYYNIHSDGTTVSVGVNPLGNHYVGDITIPATVAHDGVTYTVTGIDGWAFFYELGLTGVSIPRTVTAIHGDAFNYCQNLTTITVENGNPIYDSRDGCNAIIETATGTLLQGCKGTVIPNGITAIGKEAFYYCSTLTAVNIPNTVTTIGANAFEGCGLTSIDIPNSVTTVGDEAFYGCYDMTSVSFGSGVREIGEHAFTLCTSLSDIIVADGNPVFDSREGCHALIESATSTLLLGCKSSVFPSSLRAIGDYAFYYCVGLQQVDIPSSVITIGEGAFYYCPTLTSVTVGDGDGATTIGNRAFSHCSILSDITFGRSVTSLGNAILENCSCLETIAVESGNPRFDSRENCNALIETASNTLILGCKGSVIPNTVTTIGDSAFYACYGLKRIDIPNSVMTIGSYAFAYCSELNIDLTLGDAVREIGDYAFSHAGLTSLNIGNHVELIGNYAFEYCDKMQTAVIGNPDECHTPITVIDSRAFYVTGLTNVTLGSSVKTIKSYAFGSYLSSLTFGIGNSSIEIKHNAFSSNSLTEIVVKEGNTYYDSREECNALIETASNTLLLGCPTTVIPNSVTAIGDNAFRDCTGLPAVSIPESVTAIGEYAFYNTGLTSIDIPYSVASIGRDAFYGCAGLTDLSYNVKNCEYHSGFGNQIERVTIGPKVEKIPQNFVNNSKITEVTIPNSVTVIDFRAFFGCKELTNVTFSNSITAINSEAFMGCTSLTSVKFPDLLNSIWIHQRAFSDCTGLTDLEFPDSTFVNHYAFEGCTGLTNVTFRCTNFSWLGQEPFKGCTNLMSVTCTGTNPPQCPYDWSRDAFSTETYQEGVLLVPEEAMGKYREADGWRKFANIGPIPGNSRDVNGDGMVNIADINSLINAILTSGKGEQFDVNGDNEVNITDVNAVIKTILNK